MAVVGSVGLCHRPPKLAEMTVHAAHPRNGLLLSIQQALHHGGIQAQFWQFEILDVGMSLPLLGGDALNFFDQNTCEQEIGHHNDAARSGSQGTGKPLL